MSAKSQKTPREANKNRTRNKINRKMKEVNQSNTNIPRTPMTPKTDTFAWSKTQSSPDPSELPMPRFLKGNSANSENVDKMELLKSTFSKVIGTPTKTSAQSDSIQSLKNTLGIKPC